MYELALLGAGALTPVASAATPSTVFRPFATPNPEPQPGGRWGERLVVADDMNGDGVKDIWTSTPSADGQFPDQGRVYLLSGKDRSILRTIDSPEPQGGFSALLSDQTRLARGSGSAHATGCGQLSAEPTVGPCRKSA